jgi:hypothetical protein
MLNIEVRELRSGERFALVETLVGSFGGVQIHVRNIAEQGAQIEHAEPLRIAMRARLWFKRGDVAVSTQGLVVWSHLSRTPNHEGKYLYVSGVRIESDVDAFATAIQTLASGGLLRRDPASLEKKKERLAARESERARNPVMKIIPQDVEVPGDQALLVQHARERLRANPDEAMKWYNRARFATSDDGGPVVAAEMIRHRQDVLAVWEYLERTVPLAVVMRVFDR